MAVPSSGIRRIRAFRAGVVSLAMALLALVGSAVVAPVAASATVAPSVSFMEWDYSGAHSDDGAYNNVVVPYINAFQPGVLMLEEICESQFDALLADPLMTWTFNGAKFIPKKDTTGLDPNCHKDSTGSARTIGNAILTHQNIVSGSFDSQLMPVDVNGVEDKVACLRTKVGNAAVPIEACDVHLDTVDVNARHQLNGQASPQWEGADKWARDHADDGTALVLGGDFNITPTDSGLNDIYNGTGGGTGPYHEPDQCMSVQHDWDSHDLYSPAGCDRFTHDARDTGTDVYTKINYMFFKSSYARNYAPAPPINLGHGNSDHFLTAAYVDICSTSC